MCRSLESVFRRRQKCRVASLERLQCKRIISIAHQNSSCVVESFSDCYLRGFEYIASVRDMEAESFSATSSRSLEHEKVQRPPEGPNPSKQTPIFHHDKRAPTAMASVIDKAKSALGMDDRQTVKLAGRSIHPIGYGLMGLTWRKNPPSREQSFAAMKAALANGSNFWNGGEIYGNASRNSLHLLQEYFEKYPDDRGKVVISIKGGCLPDQLKPDGKPENVKRSIQECIDILGKSGKKLDIWESARVDPETPIEVTMRTAKEFVDAGKLGGISLSECSAETIRRAAKVAKIEAVEVEFSLWETTILENGIAATCAELGIPIVAYSPLGRGFLTGSVRKFEDIPEDDLRRDYPRFQPENFEKNLKLLEEVEKMAKAKGCTPGQVGISWILAKSGKDGLPVMIPIPGSTTEERVRENLVTVELSANDVKEIDSLLEQTEVAGERYPERATGLLFGNTPKET